MNVETALIKKIGDTGGKLHTARSRNDQVALDLRLYVRAEMKEIISLVRSISEDACTYGNKVSQHADARIYALTEGSAGAPLPPSARLR